MNHHNNKILITQQLYIRLLSKKHKTSSKHQH